MCSEWWFQEFVVSTPGHETDPMAKTQLAIGASDPVYLLRLTSPLPAFRVRTR